MSDEQWLEAVNGHGTGTAGYEAPQDGAHELSQQLKAQAIADPARFARLALRFGRQAHPAYSEAVLITLADTGERVDSALVFDVIRHVASLGYEEHQDWLGWPLRQHLNLTCPTT